MLRRRAVASVLVVLALLSVGAPAGASEAARRPVVTLSVGPGHLAVGGTAISMAASVRPAGATGFVRFYDGAHLLAAEPCRSGAPVLATTRSLTTGIHRLRVVFGRGAPFRPVAWSRIWVLVVTPVPTTDDQVITVAIPTHAPVKVEPQRIHRPPHVQPPKVGGAGQGRGGLAYTGVALLGLLLFGATLIATGSAARWGGRRRARRAVRAVAGVLTIVGGLGVTVVYVGGGSRSLAEPTPAYPTALPPDAPDDRTLAPVWPSSAPRATLRVLGPAGRALAEPIVVRPGQQLTVLASGFAPDDDVVAHSGDAGPASTRLRADGGGTVRFEIVVPSGVPEGLHTISLAGRRLTAAVGFTVQGRAR